MTFPIEEFADELRMELEAKKDEMISKFNQLGLRASGRWEDLCQVEIDIQGFSIEAKIIVAHYTIQLAIGRKPGKFPNLRDIEKWVDVKGNKPPGISKDTWVFLVARKIAREGTEIYKRGGTDLIEATITKEWLTGLQRKFADRMHQAVKENLNEKLKGALKKVA